jgi:hypothetical protein
MVAPMDAFSRVVAALLLLLWASVGVPLAGTAPGQGNRATRSRAVTATSCRRREGESGRAGTKAEKPSVGDDEDVEEPIGFPPRPASDRASSEGLAVATETRRPHRVRVLAGKPRGPPLRTMT